MPLNYTLRCFKVPLSSFTTHTSPACCTSVQESRKSEHRAKSSMSIIVHVQIRHTELLLFTSLSVLVKKEQNSPWHHSAFIVLCLRQQEASLCRALRHGFLTERHVAVSGCRFLHGSLDWQPVPRISARRRQGVVRLAAMTEHFSVDLQSGVAWFHVEDLTEAFGLFLQSVDRLQRHTKWTYESVYDTYTCR